MAQELRKMWKFHAQLLKENQGIDPAENKKVTKATDLKIGQLVFVKDHWQVHSIQLTLMIIEFQKF